MKKFYIYKVRINDRQEEADEKNSEGEQNKVNAVAESLHFGGEYFGMYWQCISGLLPVNAQTHPHDHDDCIFAQQKQRQTTFSTKLSRSRTHHEPSGGCSANVELNLVVCNRDCFLPNRPYFLYSRF